MNRRVYLLAVVSLVGLTGAQTSLASEPRQGLSVFGQLKYPADFRHFDYVNPDAPKGGTLRMGSGGTFYSLQPFIRQGSAAAGLTQLLYDTLLTRAWDETSSVYGLLAETVELADDRSWLEFVLRPEARWHDGEPVTADDVVFTVGILREKGSPSWKTLLLAVEGAEKLGPRRVRIHLSSRATRQLPLQIGAEMQILPRHYWATREFDKTTLEPPLGSGPYRVADVDPGRSIRYERVHDYWGRDLNVNIGRFNFERIQYKYFQDLYVQMEAIKGHDVDWRSEFSAKRWATGYDTPARQRGHFILETLETGQPAIRAVWAFNLRRKKLQDPRVREALVRAYHQQWISAVLLYDDFKSARSFFENSDMEHRGPPSPGELELLEPFRAELDARIFERQWDPPVGLAHGSNRENLHIADRLLERAGWVVREGARVNERTGERLELQFLVGSPSISRHALPYMASLEQLGIQVEIRSPFSTEYQNLVGVERDFDLSSTLIALRLVPGTELRNLFGSEAADRPYSRNTAGIRNPIVDALIEKIIGARSRGELVTAASALDRVLSWGFYYVSIGKLRSTRHAYWNIFGRPEVRPRYSTGFPFTWWIDSAKQELVASGQPIEVD